MNTIYHQLLSIVAEPMAIFQTAPLLLLDSNHLFNQLCPIAPFHGGTLTDFGFSEATKNAVIAQCALMHNMQCFSDMPWLKAESIMNTHKQNISVRIHFLELGTGHLLLTLKTGL